MPDFDNTLSPEFSLNDSNVRGSIKGIYFEIAFFILIIASWSKLSFPRSNTRGLRFAPKS